MEMATAMLKEGVPFDDPIPTVEYAGKHFCFTGKFQYGSRTCCNNTIVRMGGLSDENVTLDTNYLIVGGKLARHGRTRLTGVKSRRLCFTSSKASRFPFWPKKIGSKH